MTTVLFWDIDGTLLTTGRAGIFAFEEALAAVCGRSCSLENLATAGLTDAEVARLVLETAGEEPTDERARAILREYERRLPACLPRRQGRVMPGVLDVLESLGAEEGVVHSLLTGNTAAGAQAKLRHYGLAEYFSGGAFCNGSNSRPEIAREARALARERFGDPEPDRIFVIGDTPHDITCGKAIGARTIGVATGTYGVDELASHDPWRVVERIPDPAEFRRLVGIPA